jgi:hypothetical protein
VRTRYGYSRYALNAYEHTPRSRRPPAYSTSTNDITDFDLHRRYFPRRGNRDVELVMEVEVVSRALRDEVQHSLTRDDFLRRVGNHVSILEVL